MPWNEGTEDAYDITGARQILDEDHTGLDDVKERIVEYLAVRKRREDRGARRVGTPAAAVPCWRWSGRPGSAKDLTGRVGGAGDGPQVRQVALGGIRDEAEIRGHRRTYVGALPAGLSGPSARVAR
jgi:ATP-dependent Lon protease